MTSTLAGLNGASLGWINYDFIKAGKNNLNFNNYGGEDRFWLGPEGGQFSLWFAKDKKQTLAHWFTPPALNDGAFKITSGRDEPRVRLERRMQLTNTSGTRFDLHVTRDVELRSVRGFKKLFGEKAAAVLKSRRLKMVGFETINRITNRGAAINRTGGMPAIWILGMFPPGARTAIIVPYRKGDATKLGPVVRSDYFGKIPSDRLKVTPEAILFRGDGRYRAKIGTSQRRAVPMAGALDFDTGVLTLVIFDAPKVPSNHPYVNNTWGVPQKEPYRGDVLNSYNDGPPEPGKKALGGFFELESVSPAAELAQGKSLVHRHATFHVQGDANAIAKLVKIILGVDVKKVKTTMFPDAK